MWGVCPEKRHRIRLALIAGLVLPCLAIAEAPPRVLLLFSNDRMLPANQLMEQGLRPWTERVYGIPPERVVGSSGGLKFQMRDGKSVLIKLPEIAHNDDKEGKPVGIQRHIGRRPIFAAGNSDGDLQMLQWTAAGTRPSFCLYIHHTDAAREWAYDRESYIGKLDKGLDEAQTRGWTVSRMKDA